MADAISQEPVTLAEAKVQLRGSSASEDGLIGDAIVAAREWVERYTGHLLVRQTVTQDFPAFGPYLDLRAWPIVSVDSVTYLDTGYVSQTLDPATYLSAYGVRPGRITTRGYWPTAGGPITVTVTAGYAEGQVPRLLKMAMLMLVTGYYENRSGLPEDVERAAESLCRSFRLWRV